MSTNTALSGILEKITSHDKGASPTGRGHTPQGALSTLSAFSSTPAPPDFRYMATNDLLAELGKESFKMDVDGEKRVCQARCLPPRGALTTTHPKRPALATPRRTGADACAPHRWC